MKYEDLYLSLKRIKKIIEKGLYNEIPLQDRLHWIWSPNQWELVEKWYIIVDYKENTPSSVPTLTITTDWENFIKYYETTFGKIKYYLKDNIVILNIIITIINILAMIIGLIADINSFIK